MDELLPDALARLSATVETLECRVYALEHPASNQQAPSQSEAIESPAAIPRTTSSPQSAGIFSVVGKAMLGIAGAYLLRAMAESTTFPRAVVVPVALTLCRNVAGGSDPGKNRGEVCQHRIRWNIGPDSDSHAVGTHAAI